MKEKIVFFIFGAVLATIAYTIGDNNSNAQNFRAGITEFDEIQCRKLTVFSEIQASKLMVYDPINESGAITLDFSEYGPIMTIANFDENSGVVFIQALRGSAEMSLTTRDKLANLKKGLSLVARRNGSEVTIEGEEISKSRQ